MANHHTADGTNAVAALKNAYCAHLSEDDENLTESNLDAMRHNTESLHLVYVAFQSHWTKGDAAGAEVAFENCVAILLFSKFVTLLMSASLASVLARVIRLTQ